MVGGSALRRAADAIIEKAKLMAAAMLEADAGDLEFKDGNFNVVGTDKAIPLIEVAKASFAPMGPMTRFGIGLEGPAVTRRNRQAIQTARMRWRSRSTQRPEKWPSTAT